MSLSLLKSAGFDRVMNAVAAGTTNQNSSGVNLEGFDNACFVAAFGTITATAVTGIKLQQSDDDGSTDDYTDLAGSALSIADTGSNKILVSEVPRARKKWVRAVITRGTANAVIDGVFCIKTHPRVAPVTQGSTVANSESNVSPAEGTA